MELYSSRFIWKMNWRNTFSFQLCADSPGIVTTAVGVEKKLMYDLMCIFTPNHDLDQLLPETPKNKH